MKTRDAKIDNLKGILIFLVVFGHLLELVITKGHAKYIYELIYSFHMPFFIFLSGYFYFEEMTDEEKAVFAGQEMIV